MHILVVDDEELIRNVIEEYLPMENYIVDEAEDGDDAVKKATIKSKSSFKCFFAKRNR